MIIFRCKSLSSGASAAIVLSMLPTTLTAQAVSSPILLAPIQASSGLQKTAVTNVYGSCGSAVVQVLGVNEDVGEFFTVDASAGNADIVVIAAGGRRQISLKRYLSDFNGVACVGKSAKKVLVWSNCGGTACGNKFNFTVVDVQSLRIIAGGPTECHEVCAARATGSDLPKRLNK